MCRRPRRRRPGWGAAPARTRSPPPGSSCALPANARTAHAGYRAAATRLTGVLADTVAAQEKYPCLPVTAGSATFAIELHPATCVGGVGGPWLNARVLAHLFRATIGNPGGLTLGRHAGVIVLCWRNLAVSEHRGGVGMHYLGDCRTCEPLAAGLGLSTAGAGR